MIKAAERGVRIEGIHLVEKKRAASPATIAPEDGSATGFTAE